MYVCDNCGKRYDREDDFTHFFPNIPDLQQRLDIGGTVPAAECPACGALVYREAKPVRVLVLLDGGLVQGVLADKPDVEVAVLDQDIEGADEDEIVEVVGEVDTLRGTLQAHAINVAPALIESAWRPL
jgi:predicted RNA-binding Zn-ribbon protein involved in translation (DUF1610 family)